MRESVQSTRRFSRLALKAHMVRLVRQTCRFVPVLIRFSRATMEQVKGMEISASAFQAYGALVRVRADTERVQFLAPFRQRYGSEVVARSRKIIQVDIAHSGKRQPAQNPRVGDSILPLATT